MTYATRYVLLKAGDVIRDGDEYWQVDKPNWLPSGYVGSKVLPGFLYRRADLSSPLGVVAMRDVASAVVAGMAPFYIGETRFADHASLAKQIANIPLPDHETLLAVAMNLPEVAALRKALHFYADFYENPNEGPWGVNSEDFGKVARTALEARHRKESLHPLD